MFLKKSKSIFLFLSILVHGIIFGLLLFFNLLNEHDRNRNIYEVTTVTIFNEKKQTFSIQKKAIPSAAEGKDLKNKLEKISENTKLSEADVPTKSKQTSESNASAVAASDDQMPSLLNENAVTDGVHVLNMNEVTKSVKRTDTAILNNIEGKVRLKILVDETGTVRKITALNSLGYGLDEVAVGAAKKLRFTPARIKAKPVALEAIYTIIFTTHHK